MAKELGTFVVHTPRETFHEDLDSTTTSKRQYVCKDSELDAVSNTLNTPEYSDDFERTSISMGGKTDTIYTPHYSDDFESISGGMRSYGKITRNPSRYSGELETVKTSMAETIPEETALSVDDLEDDAQNVTSAGRTSRLTFQYSREFDEDTVQPTSGRTSRLTWQYSEDFEDTDRGYLDTEREHTYMFATESQSSRRYGDDDTSSQVSDTTTDHTTWADSSELSEATSEATYLAEHNFMKKTLNRLKQGDRGRSRPTHTRKPDDKKGGTDPEDEAALKSRKIFCKNLLNRLNSVQKGKSVPSEVTKGSVRLHLQGLDPAQCVQNHGICHMAINRLKLENTRAKLEKMAKEPVHQPDKCPHCISMLEEVAANDFIRKKLLIAQELRIADHLSMAPHLGSTLIKEPVILPGEMQRELTHMKPAAIWNKLSHPHQTQGTSPDPPAGNDSDTFGRSSPVKNRVQTCPYSQYNKPQVISDTSNYREDLSEYIQKTQQQVDEMKHELHQEADRLLTLDSQQFWKTYFSKIKG